MGNYEQAVFISYAWGSEREDIVNEIHQSLQVRGVKIIRDKQGLAYKGFIKEFMERIGRGNCIIVVISDKYLKSPNCMFELVEIAKNKEFPDRIFPVVLSDADIYDPAKRIEYVRYWELKKEELDQKMRNLSDLAHLQGIRDELDDYDHFRDQISGLASILKDMNALTPEMHRDSNFSALYDAIEKRMKESDSRGVSMSKPESFQEDEQASKSTVTFNQGGQTVTNQENIGGNKIINAKNYIQGGQNNRIIEGTTVKEVFDGLSQLIEKLPAGEDKNIAQNAVQSLKIEAEKGEQADEGRVKKMLKFLLDTAPDAWEVAVNTFLNPVAGIGTIFRKVAERAKAEQ